MSSELTPPGKLFGIDRRSLVVFRVGLGILIVADLVKRAISFREHYTPQGMFPREAALGLRPDSPLFRVYLAFEGAWWPALLFGIAAILGLMLAVGYRTRIVSLVSLVLLVSLVRRNPYVTHTGDVLLQALLFWSLFLPLSGFVSVDRLRGRTPPNPQHVTSLGTAAVLLQMVAFYVCAGVLKHQNDVWVRGDALWVFTNIEEYTRGFGLFLKDYPGLCKILTYATLALEIGGPILLFSPLLTGPIRTAIVFLFIGFHLGIQLTVYIGIFEVLSIVAVSLFLPAWFWDRFLPRIPIGLRRFWKGAEARWRRRWGRADRVTFDPPRLLRWPANALCCGALGLMLFSNWNSTRSKPVPLPRVLDDYGRHLALVQNWNIFSDIEGTFYGWFLVLGQLEDGSIVDVLEDRPFQGVRRPAHFASFFPNHNTRRFWRQMALPVNEWIRPWVARYLVRKWNERHDVKLERLAAYHVGNAPGRGEAYQRLQRLFLYATPRPELRNASAEDQRLYRGRQESWRQFLEGLPTRLHESEPAALERLAALEERMGGRAAWDRLEHLAWVFPGPRRHLWWKPRGLARIEIPGEGLVVFLDLGSGTGDVWRSGSPVETPSERRALLSRAKRIWNNDSWWVFMPWKLRDPGVAVRLRGEGRLRDGRPAEFLSVHFNGVGTTPRNRYLLGIAKDTGLLEEWSFYRDFTDREPTFTRPWSEWRDFGGLLFATDKGRDHDWQLALLEDLPPECYSDPALDAFALVEARRRP